MSDNIPKTSLKGTDLVAAVFGPKSGPHVVLFANAKQIELVSIYPYRKHGSSAYFIDIRQRLSPTDSEEFLMSLLDILDYDVEGMHHYSPGGHRITRGLAVLSGFSHYMGEIYMKVDVPEIHGLLGLPANLGQRIIVSRTRARQLARELADILGWEFER